VYLVTAVLPTPPVPGDLLRLALADAQQRYDDVIGNFPV